MAKPSNKAHRIHGGGTSDFLRGTSEEDVLFGYAGEDILFGGDGRDFLYGGDGDDALHGEGGDDYLDGGAGSDLLDGGTGLDSINYHTSSVGVRVDLQAQTASGGDADGDILIGIELARGSWQDDILIGSDGDNFLCGLGGDDSMYGGVGDDTMRGAEDADYLDGGTGWDIATYWSSDAGVTVDLGAGTGSGGHAEGDTLVSIEAVLGSEEWADTLIAGNGGSHLYGYGGDDSVIGADGCDLLSGGDGDDTLVGGGNRDMLFGEDGDDVLDGGSGNDLITGGQGDDLIAGGLGRDQFKFRQGDGTDVITDFEAGRDRIIFSDHQTTWRDLVTSMDGENAVIAYGEADILIVENASLSDVWDSFGFY